VIREVGQDIGGSPKHALLDADLTITSVGVLSSPPTDERQVPDSACRPAELRR